MLSSFQQKGDFEFRSPTVDNALFGELAEAGNPYLRLLSTELKRSVSTLEQVQRHLYRFCRFMEGKSGLPGSLTVNDIDSFIKSETVQKGGAASHCLTIRRFLHFLFEKGELNVDIASAVPRIPSYRGNSLPTTYTEEEINRLLATVECSSALGKRDYLILLLASRYGLRASDIITLSFDDFDWDNNTIRHKIKKTGEFIELPLLAEVGNAIYDYLSCGRPKTDCRLLIVSHCPESWGRPITSSHPIHAVVAKQMEAANIKDWRKKRHGPHALRHSLAAAMEGRDTSISVIAQVLGHQSTKATSAYLKVDIEKLRRCPLPMPLLDSPYYDKEGGHAEI